MNVNILKNSGAKGSVTPLVLEASNEKQNTNPTGTVLFNSSLAGSWLWADGLGSGSKDCGQEHRRPNGLKD